MEIQEAKEVRAKEDCPSSWAQKFRTPVFLGKGQGASHPSKRHQARPHTGGAGRGPFRGPV